MARTKVISAKEAAALIKDGDTVLVGGFMTNGTAKSIVNEVTAKNLTVCLLYTSICSSSF